MTLYLNLRDDEGTLVFNAASFIFRGDHLEITTVSGRLSVYPIENVAAFMVVGKEV